MAWFQSIGMGSSIIDLLCDESISLRRRHAGRLPRVNGKVPVWALAALSRVDGCGDVARHVPREILRCKPPRAYRCFPFEGYNRRLKKWAKHSNRKDTLGHVAKMLALQAAAGIAN